MENPEGRQLDLEGALGLRNSLSGGRKAKKKPQCSSGVLKIWFFSTSKGPEVSRKCFIKSTLLKYNLYAIKCT